MTRTEIIEIFDRLGVIKPGHWNSTSGLLHFDRYVDKDRIYIHPAEIRRLCRFLAWKFSDLPVDAVVAPEKGGIILSHLVAHFLSEVFDREVASFFAEKTGIGDSFVIKRGDATQIIPGKKILIVEDVLTTGKSLKRVVDTVCDMQGIVCGAGAIINRGGVTAKDLGESIQVFTCLVNLKLSSWTKEECPLCKEGIPIVQK